MTKTCARTTTALAIALMLLATSCSTDEIAEPAEGAVEATTTTTAAPTTTTTTESSEDSGTTSSAPEDDGWDDITGWSGNTSGRVRALFFEPAFAFDAPEDFSMLCLPGPNHAGISPPIPNNELRSPPFGSVPAGMMVITTAATTVAEQSEILVAGLATATEPEPTSVGGADGVTFDGVAPEEAGTLYLSPSGDCTAKFDLGEAWRFSVVEVAGTPVTFAIYSPETEFDSNLAALQPIVDSVQWRALSES